MGSTRIEVASHAATGFTIRFRVFVFRAIGFSAFFVGVQKLFQNHLSGPQGFRASLAWAWTFRMHRA